jgi:hypothetical protein
LISTTGEAVHVPLGQTLAELDGRLCIAGEARHRSDVEILLFEIWKLQDAPRLLARSFCVPPAEWLGADSAGLWA